MDSDDSYESTSEDVHDSDIVESTSTSQESVNRNSIKLIDLYTSAFSQPTLVDFKTSEQTVLLSLQIKELNNHIDALKQERICLLEQITVLCSSLEKKEEELVDFMHYYEQKANDVAEYMQKVQVLLSQLNTLFLDHTSEQGQPDQPPSSKRKTLAVNIDAISLKDLADSPFDCANARDQEKTDWSEQTRSLLQALSVSVETATARNKQVTQSRSSTLEATHRAPGLVRNQQALAATSSRLIDPPAAANSCAATDSPEGTVSRLPPFCWTVEHVLHWLTVYACLPGGCTNSAKRHQIDGKQLTSLPSNKLEKLLCLNDAGLRQKLHLALEDLRVHGPPGTSRCPGPSHIRPQWVCNVWLRRHIGLSQLAPVFALRRVDGRLLASLAIYKSSVGLDGGFPIIHHVVNQDHSTPSPSVSLASNHMLTSDSISVNGRVKGPEATGSWSGASHKKMRRILLGIGRDTVSSTGSDACSGADLPTEIKYLLGKREACSLRCGIELLRRFNFNIDLIEETRRKCELSDDPNLLLWSNEQVTSWLINLGLKDFVEGIDGTGLHGAYMVLDATFDSARLIKHLRIPGTIASAHQLDARLQALLHPARVREGIVPKHTSRHTGTKRNTTSGFLENHSSPKLRSSVTDTNSDATSHVLMNSIRNDKTLMPSRLADSLSTDSSSARQSHDSLEQAVRVERQSQDKRDANGFPQTKTNNNNATNTNNYLAKVLSRGRSVLRGSLTGTQKGKNIPVSTNQLSPQTEDEGGWATLVRKSSTSSTHLSNQVEMTAPGSSKVSPAAVLLHPSQSTRTTPARGVVKACEAALVDPFNREEGRSRMRIFLGQTVRSNICSVNNVSSSVQPYPSTPVSPTSRTASSVEESLSTCSSTSWLSSDRHRQGRHQPGIKENMAASSDLSERFPGLPSLV